MDPNGVDQNDCFDVDDGGNNLQNFPELFAPVFNGNGTVTVQGTLYTTPATDFVIDFYSNTAADTSDYGEGENYLGAVLYLQMGTVSLLLLLLRTARLPQVKRSPRRRWTSLGIHTSFRAMRESAQRELWQRRSHAGRKPSARRPS